jgi:glycosyltransferase involved in cell wall biosynthesis
MRVLHVNAGNLYGGIETLLVTLARERHLCQDLEPCFALCFEGRVARELRATGVSVSLLGAARVRYPWTILAVRRRLAALLEAERPDVVVTHGAWSHAIAAPVVRDSGVMLAHWVHAPPAVGHWLERWARRTPPDVAIANSRFTARGLASFFPGVRTEVIYAPVSPPPARDRAEVRSRIRAELTTAADATVIVIASRLEPLKGHRILLEALANVPGAIAWIAGGPQRPAEKAYAAELEAIAAKFQLGARVRFLGECSFVPELLAAADIHCQPNVAPDSFGLAFVEALDAGLPVVTTAIGGALEIVDETCGILVSADAPRELAAVLARLAADPVERARAGASGRVRARLLCDPAARLGELRAALAREAPVNAGQP